MEARFSGPSPVLQAVNGWHLVTIWSPISVLQFLHRVCKLLICNGFFKMNGSNSIEFNELLIRRSLVRAQVEEPDKNRNKPLRAIAGAFFLVRVAFAARSIS